MTWEGGSKAESGTATELQHALDNLCADSMEPSHVAEDGLMTLRCSPVPPAISPLDCSLSLDQLENFAWLR